MTMEARQATIDRFNDSIDVTVFLISLKAGGVALNLTTASRVIMCDSWWNPAVEYQAMDRIHRLGQHRPVVRPASSSPLSPFAFIAEVPSIHSHLALSLARHARSSALKTQSNLKVRPFPDVRPLDSVRLMLNLFFLSLHVHFNYSSHRATAQEASHGRQYA
jgi:hypothetical protein